LKGTGRFYLEAMELFDAFLVLFTEDIDIRTPGLILLDLNILENWEELGPGVVSTILIFSKSKMAARIATTLSPVPQSAKNPALLRNSFRVTSQPLVASQLLLPPQRLLASQLLLASQHHTRMIDLRY
jgi:hypothetical protein